MNIKQNIWLCYKRTNEFFVTHEFQEKGKVLKGSILSILAGVIIAGIVIGAQNVNPFEYFANLFKVSLNPLYINETLQWFSVYTVAGLSLAIGFKTGLFNIGVSGQMLAGASISTIIYKALIEPTSGITGGWATLMFIICVITGALLATFAGALKAFFGIHEVVSTIMINWIIWYIFKFIFFKWNNLYGDGIGGGSANIPENTLQIFGSNIAIPLMMAGICVIIIAVLLAKTVFGFNLKAVGSSPSASKYAGINVRRQMIQSMAISGAIAGVASFINMFTIAPNISFTLDSLPMVGYDAIAIALVASNSALGIILVSCLWAIIQSGGTVTSSLYNMPIQMSSLIFGIIVYFAAIAIVFTKFAPLYWFKLKYFIKKSYLKNNHVNQLQTKIMKWKISAHTPNMNPEFKTNYQALKLEISQVESEQAKPLKQKIKEYKKDFKADALIKMQKYQNELNSYKTNIYQEEIHQGLNGLKLKDKKTNQLIARQAIKQISHLKMQDQTAKDELNQMCKSIIYRKYNEIQAAKKSFVKQKSNAKLWQKEEIKNIKLTNKKAKIKIEFKNYWKMYCDKLISIFNCLTTKNKISKCDSTIIKELEKEEIIKVKYDYLVKFKQIKTFIKIKKMHLDFIMDNGQIIDLENLQNELKIKRNKLKLIKNEMLSKIKKIKLDSIITEEQQKTAITKLKNEYKNKITAIRIDIKIDKIKITTNRQFTILIQQLAKLKITKAEIGIKIKNIKNNQALTKEQKHEEIVKLKHNYHVKINTIKAMIKIKKIKISTIKKLYFLHQKLANKFKDKKSNNSNNQQLIAVKVKDKKIKNQKSNNQQYVAIKKQYEVKIAQAKQDYKQAITSIQSEHELIVSQHSYLQSEQLIAKANDIWKKYQNQIKEVVKPIKSNVYDYFEDKKQINQYSTNVIKLINLADKEIKQLYGEKIFYLFDNKEIINAKKKISLQMQQAVFNIVTKQIIEIEKIELLIQDLYFVNILIDLKMTLKEVKADYVDQIKVQKILANHKWWTKPNNDLKDKLITIESNYIHRIQAATKTLNEHHLSLQGEK